MPPWANGVANRGTRSIRPRAFKRRRCAALTCRAQFRVRSVLRLIPIGSERVRTSPIESWVGPVGVRARMAVLTESAFRSRRAPFWARFVMWRRRQQIPHPPQAAGRWQHRQARSQRVLLLFLVVRLARILLACGLFRSRLASHVLLTYPFVHGVGVCIRMHAAQGTVRGARASQGAAADEGSSGDEQETRSGALDARSASRAQQRQPQQQGLSRKAKRRRLQAQGGRIGGDGYSGRGDDP